MIDYATEANIKAYRKPLGILNKAILKAVREPLTFWISSEPPVKNKVAGLMDASLSRSEHFPASAYRSVTYVSKIEKILLATQWEVRFLETKARNRINVEIRHESTMSPRLSQRTRPHGSAPLDFPKKSAINKANRTG